MNADLHQETLATIGSRKTASKNRPGARYDPSLQKLTSHVDLALYRAYLSEANMPGTPSRVVQPQTETCKQHEAADAQVVKVFG